MRFDEFDKQMRIYEQSLDQVVLPDMYIAARLDGRSFTRLTKEICQFEAPFDIRFRDLMTDTACHLMACGFRIVYAYTESDEISLLFHPDEQAFGRKTRKLNTTLAGEASAVFSLALGKAATFDCRIIPLPNKERVRDYFIWRQEDAHRNSLNSYCYWTLRKEGLPKQQATAMLEGKTVSYKNELLFKRGINYNNLPCWQKRGTGIYYKDIVKEGYNPVTNKNTETIRRKLYIDYELKTGKEYGDWAEHFLEL